MQVCFLYIYGMPTSVKRYEILESLPAYGPMYIPVSEDGEPFYSEGFAVRFYKADGTDWVANFREGWADLKTVIELSDTTDILVIAAGTCYLMNPEEAKPVSVFGADYRAVFAAQDGKHVLYDSVSLTIVEPDGGYWHTERISWDGITEVALNKNIVTGLADRLDDVWVKFSYNIDTKELIGGSYPSILP